MRQILNAMRYYNSFDIIHRDLKPLVHLTVPNRTSLTHLTQIKHSHGRELERAHSKQATEHARSPADLDRQADFGLAVEQHSRTEDADFEPSKIKMHSELTSGMCTTFSNAHFSNIHRRHRYFALHRSRSAVRSATCA